MIREMNKQDAVPFFLTQDVFCLMANIHFALSPVRYIDLLIMVVMTCVKEQKT